MGDIDAVAGMYNIIDPETYRTADYQVPIGRFIEKLEDRDIPDEICTVGVEDLLVSNDERQERLTSVMREQMDYLNNLHPLPSIQFAVKRDIQSVGDTFEIEVDGEFYSLEPLFGRRIKERKPGWLVCSFRV